MGCAVFNAMVPETNGPQPFPEKRQRHLHGSKVQGKVIVRIGVQGNPNK